MGRTKEGGCQKGLEGGEDDNSFQKKIFKQLPNYYEGEGFSFHEKKAGKGTTGPQCPKS